MSKHKAGTDDSVYPSEEYSRTLRGRVRWGRRRGGVNVDDDDDDDEGEVEARERDVERGVGKREETEMEGGVYI